MVFFFDFIEVIIIFMVNEKYSVMSFKYIKIFWCVLRNVSFCLIILGILENIIIKLFN